MNCPKCQDEQLAEDDKKNCKLCKNKKVFALTDSSCNCSLCTGDKQEKLENGCHKCADGKIVVYSAACCKCLDGQETNGDGPIACKDADATRPNWSKLVKPRCNCDKCKDGKEANLIVLIV